MLRVQATPFVPGRSRGVLRRGGSGAGPNSVLVLTHQELAPFIARPDLDGENRPAGLIVTGGAPLSHPMIRLLGLGIPTVVVSRAQSAELAEGMEAVIDGASGLIGSPGEGEPPGPFAPPEAPRPGSPVMTADGEAVELRASIADARGAAAALAGGAASIGLLRSEYLSPAGAARPGVDFYEDALRAVCAAAHPLPVTVRLLDLTVDKCPSWVGRIPGMEGALGLQGLRLYGIEPVCSAVRAQVEAVGRLAPRFDLSLLLPYVVCPEEFRHWRCEIERLLPVPMTLGTMVETPAAALEMKAWMELADFVAVGCNDLMQCLFAADRDLVQVSGLLDPYAPVLLRLLRQMAEAAGDLAGRVQLCGLLPQAPGLLPVLLGLGYRTFSVEARLIPYLARIVRQTDTYAAQARALAACVESDADSVRALLGLPPGSVWAIGTAAGTWDPPRVSD